ncbi:MAG: hypothetical protein M9958_00355 [Chitinophagales bacterium]|nr:hypothetical protein [Chitinophagales bacterium]
MIYTNKLRSQIEDMGFEMILDSLDIPGDDVELHYEVWSKGCLEVTLQYTPTTVAEAGLAHKEYGFMPLKEDLSLTELRQLDKIINN